MSSTSPTKTIEITIAPNGQARVETKGFQGASCGQASRLIEQALGARQAEQLKPEYFAAQPTTERLQEGQ